MPAGGEGYRVVLGGIELALDIACPIIGLILLYTRRNYHPLKDMNPVLLATTLTHFLPSVFWVSLREVVGSKALGVTCGRLVWIYNICLLTFAVPWIVFAYRLYLVSDFERRKIAFAITELHRAQTATTVATTTTTTTGTAGAPANGGTTALAVLKGGGAGTGTGTAGGGGGGGGTVNGGGAATPLLGSDQIHTLVKRHTNTRMLSLIVLLISPVFVYVPVFLAADEAAAGEGFTGAAAIGESELVSYDSYVGCAYFSRSAIPFILTMCWTAGWFTAVMYLLFKHKVNDGWHIRDHLGVALAYCMMFFTAWMVINIISPSINEDVFDSAIIGHGVAYSTFAHMIVYPAVQTFYMKQPVTHKHKPHHSKSGTQNRSPKNGNLFVRPSPKASSDPAVLALTTPRASRTISIGDRNTSNRPILRVLNDSHGYDEFLSYVQSEFAAENVLFWKAVEEYRSDPSIDGAVRIYRMFISDSGALQVNISYSIYQTIHETLKPFLVGTVAIPMHIHGTGSGGGPPGPGPAAAAGEIALTVLPAAKLSIGGGSASPNKYRAQPSPPSPAPLPANTTVTGGLSGSRASPVFGGAITTAPPALGLPPAATSVVKPPFVTPPLAPTTIGAAAPSLFVLNSTESKVLTRQLTITGATPPPVPNLRIATSNTLTNDELIAAAAVSTATGVNTTSSAAAHGTPSARAQLSKTPKRSSLKVSVGGVSGAAPVPTGSSPRNAGGLTPTGTSGPHSPSVHGPSAPLLFDGANSSSGGLSPAAGGGHNRTSSTTISGGVITTPSAVTIRHPSFLGVASGSVATTGLSAAATAAIASASASASAAAASAVTARPGEVVERDYIAVFDAAQREIVGMTESDSFSRFIKTTKGKALSYLWADLPPTPGTKRAAAAAAAGMDSPKLQAFTFPAANATTSGGLTPSLAPAATDVKQQ